MVTLDLSGGEPYSGSFGIYYEGYDAIPIAYDPTISSDASGILSVEIRFNSGTGSYRPGDTLSLAGPLPGGITAEQAGPGHMILHGPSGGASADDMEAAIALVRYSSTSEDANAVGRLSG